MDLFDRLRKTVTTQLWHHPICDHQIPCSRLEFFQRLMAVIGGLNIVAITLEAPAHHTSDSLLIVCEQDSKSRRVPTEFA